MSIAAKPNKTHELIDSLCRTLIANKKKVTLVTQNIDDLHIKPNKDSYEYYCVHGNIKFVRCENKHLLEYAKYLEKKENGN
jgi:NAD-dependent SIR2 family protein deacetylase